MNNDYNDWKQYSKTLFSTIFTKQYNIQYVQQTQWSQNNVDNNNNISNNKVNNENNATNNNIR